MEDSWTVEKQLKLVALYRERRFLWDPADLLHKNKPLRLDTLKAISEELQISVNALKNKINNIITQFNRIEKKLRWSAAESVGPPAKPTWFLYDKLQFLKDRHRKEPISTEAVWVAAIEAVKAENDKTVNLSEEDTGMSDVEASASDHSTTSYEATNKTFKSALKRKIDPIALPIADESLKVVKENEIASINKSDKNRTFVEHIYLVLTNLPPSSSNKVRRDIYEILYKAEEETLS